MKRMIRDRIEEIARKHRTSLKSALSDSMFDFDIATRREATVWMHDELGMSFSQIGRILNRDHTTICNSYNSHCYRMDPASERGIRYRKHVERGRRAP